MKSCAWIFSKLWSFPKYFFSYFVKDLKDIGRRVSRSFAGLFPILFELFWSVFDFYLSGALFSPCTVCYRDQLKYLIFFYLVKMKGIFRSAVCRNSQPHPYVQMVLRALASGISMQVTRWKSTTQRTFKCLQNGNWKLWKLAYRITL